VCPQIARWMDVRSPLMAAADRVVAGDVGDVGRGGGGHLAGQFAGRRLDYGYLINTTIVTMAK
jgi:hypothetical protein